MPENTAILLFIYCDSIVVAFFSVFNRQNQDFQD